MAPLQACIQTAGLVKRANQEEAEEQAEVPHRMEAVVKAEEDVVVAEVRTKGRGRNGTTGHVPCMPSKGYHAPMEIDVVTSRHG